MLSRKKRGQRENSKYLLFMALSSGQQ